MQSQISFNDAVEVITNLPLEEKEEIKDILEKNIIEERRREIYKNYKKSKKEVKEGKLKFSSNINELKKMLEL